MSKTTQNLQIFVKPTEHTCGTQEICGAEINTGAELEPNNKAPPLLELIPKPCDTKPHTRTLVEMHLGTHRCQNQCTNSFVPSLASPSWLMISFVPSGSSPYNQNTWALQWVPDSSMDSGSFGVSSECFVTGSRKVLGWVWGSCMSMLRGLVSGHNCSLALGSAVGLDCSHWETQTRFVKVWLCSGFSCNPMGLVEPQRVWLCRRVRLWGLHNPEDILSYPQFFLSFRSSSCLKCGGR